MKKLLATLLLALSFAMPLSAGAVYYPFQGGTGASTLTGLLVGHGGGTSAFTGLVGNTYGQMLVWNGSEWGLVATTSLGIISGGVWGSITGTLSDQIDLQSALDAKENDLTFTYPLQRSVDTISLGFGTTTQNTWSGHNIFASLFATNASTTNATTTNLAVIGTATTTFAGGINIGANHLVAHGIQSDASDGLHIHAGNGTNVGLFGAGNSANSLFYGGVNIDGSTRLATSLNGLAFLTSGAVTGIATTTLNLTALSFANADWGDITIASNVASVEDDSHAHTGTTLSGIDISSDTNLSGDTEVVLTGDALSLGAGVARDTELVGLGSKWATSGTAILPNVTGTGIIVGASSTLQYLNMDRATSTGALSIGGQLTVTGSATSTFSAGIALTNGTIRLDALPACGAGEALKTNTSKYIQCVAVTASASAGGSDTQLQFNDATALSGMDAYYTKANQLLGISTSTPYAKLQVNASSTPQLMLTNMLGGTDQKHWVASTTASGFFHLGTLNDALTTITPRLTIDTSGRHGIGSSTPWGFLSVVSNNNTPEFIVATTTGVAPMFSINATTSTIGGSVTVDSGARVVVGNFENYSGFGNFDQFHVDGRISSSWNYRECIPQGQTAVTADTFNYCNGWYWAEDNTGQTNITNTNGIGYMASLSTTAVGNDGNGFFMSDGNAVIRLGTSTPIMETMANIGNKGTSTSYYFGYTTMSPSGTSYEVTPTVGCYFTASSTQENWWAICQTSASLITMVDTTIASSTTTNMPRKMRIEASDTIARFYIASTSERYVKIEITTNIPTNTNMTSAGFWNGFTGATSATLTQNRYFRFVYLKGWLKNQQRFIPF